MPNDTYKHYRLLIEADYIQYQRHKVILSRSGEEVASKSRWFDSILRNLFLCISGLTYVMVRVK